MPSGDRPPQRHRRATEKQRQIMTGVLLINLGTPDAPTPEAVGTYLREFLMDKFVINGALPLRWFLVNVMIVLPLYPQYAESSFETAVVESRRAAIALGCEDSLTFLPPFYDEPEFINAWAERIRANINPAVTDHLVLSFHGIPVRHVQRLHPDHCLRSADCCAAVTAANQDCYRAQCFATARAIAAALELHHDDYTVSFQSRLGRAEWTGPNTVNVLEQLAQRGLKRIAVACPSFVADCLETLEEMGIRGRETFLAAGGEDLALIPSLNAEPRWVNAVVNWIRQSE